MKASLAGVLGGFQSLGSDDFRERPVDRLAALGAIQIAKARDAQRQAFLCSLGGDLIAFKFSHRALSRPEAEDKLAIALEWFTFKPKLSGRDRCQVAAWAVREWAGDACPPRPEGCGGALEVPDMAGQEGAQRMKPCPICAGTGKRRYTDREREQALGNPHAKTLSVAHGLIGMAEDLAVQMAKRMLER